MGILDKTFAEAQTIKDNIKDKDYVTPGYMKPRDMNPNLRWFGLAFIGTVIVLIFAEWWIKALIVTNFFLLARSFFRGEVKI